LELVWPDEMQNSFCILSMVEFLCWNIISAQQSEPGVVALTFNLLSLLCKKRKDPYELVWLIVCESVCLPTYMWIVRFMRLIRQSCYLCALGDTQAQR
jgi:hypothetical protein